MNKTYTERAFAHFCADRQLDAGAILARLRSVDNSKDREAWALITSFYRGQAVCSYQDIAAMIGTPVETIHRRLRTIEGRL